MARIAGVDVPDEKRIEVALTYIRGIGRSLARRILEEAGVDTDTRTKDLSADEFSEIRKIIDQGYEIEGELVRNVRLNIKRLKDIGCYRGIRHERGLPVRGQRTRTNARTRKGRRRVIGGTGRVASESH